MVSQFLIHSVVAVESLQIGALLRVPDTALSGNKVDLSDAVVRPDAYAQSVFDGRTAKAREMFVKLLKSGLEKRSHGLHGSSLLFSRENQNEDRRAERCAARLFVSHTL